MKRKRPPPRKSKSRTGPARRVVRSRGGKAPTSLHYKVVELSTVDEGGLERTLNEWVPQGWNLDGVQFAMRESSKRPSMAFVFFTRESAASEHDGAAARERLRQLAEGAPRTAPPRLVSAHERLAQLAGLDEPEPRLEGRFLEPEE